MFYDRKLKWHKNELFYVCYATLLVKAFYLKSLDKPTSPMTNKKNMFFKVYKLIL